MQDDYMTIEEVAEMTRLPVNTLRFYRYRGDSGPKSFKLGARVLYARSDVEAWINQARTGTDAKVGGAA